MINSKQSQIVQAVPLERLYAIHRDIKSYHEKWRGGQKLLDSVFAPGNELTFSTIQYVNRVLSPIGPILIATDYNKVGGIITIAFLYVELVLLTIKRKFLELVRSKKNEANLIKTLKILVIVIKNYPKFWNLFTLIL